MVVLEPDAFEQLVREGMDAIPEKFRKLMDNVAIIIEDRAHPARGEQYGIQHGALLLGLYEGVPKTARGPNYNLATPDRITLFKDTIEAVGQTEEGIRKVVHETIWHEIAHHFGADEGRVRQAEDHRKKRHAKHS